MRIHELAILMLVDLVDDEDPPVILCRFSPHRIVHGMRMKIGLFLIWTGSKILYGRREWVPEVRHI